MRLFRFPVTVIIAVLIFRAWGGASAITAVVPQADEHGNILTGSDFSIEIILQNDWGEMSGVSIPLEIYSPDGSITSIIHRDVGGISADSIYPGGSFNDHSILVFNNWEENWPLLSEFYGFGWDGVLPDTINYTGFGIEGWGIDDAPVKYFEFALKSDEIGTLCIDSIEHPNYIYEWLFNDPDVQFNGPYCWNIIDGFHDYIYADPEMIAVNYAPDSVSPGDAHIQITGTGDGFPWTASNSSTWLSISPDIGLTPGKLTLSFDITGLTEDIYLDTVVIESEAAVNSPLMVEVVLSQKLYDSVSTIRVPDDYPTIQQAIDMASDDCLILVMPGIYTENLIYSGKRLKIRSVSGPELTRLQPEDPDFPTILFTNGEDAGTEFSGFTVSGGQYAHTILVGENSQPLIRGNVFRTNIAADASNTAVITCIGGHPRIERNLFYNNNGISCVGINEGTADIINNTFDRNNRGFYSINGHGFAINNIVTNSRDYGIFGPFDVCNYNNVWNNNPDYDGGAMQAIGGISVDPEYVDVEMHDYSLNLNSPCIDAGDPNPIYNDPDSSRNDMGAFPSGSVIHIPVTRYVPDEYPTIQGAIDISLSGDTIMVHPGIYNEALNFKGKNIIVMSSDGPNETVITTGDGYDVVTFNHGEKWDAVLEGFTLLGGRMAVYCGNSGPTIRRNIMMLQHTTSWAAVSLAGSENPSGTAGPSPAVIVNNTIVNSANGGISSFSSVPPTIKNNIIAFNANYGIHCQGIDPPYTQPVLSYNDVYGNEIGFINIVDFGEGTISANPQFGPDHSLLSFSPCIDAGDPSPEYNDPDGSRNDMGAVPYGGQELLINLTKWASESGGNDHWYAVMTGDHAWWEARSAAEMQLHGNMPGYLATVTSQEENEFILNNVLAGVNQPNVWDLYWLGGYYMDTEWVWINFEPFVYTNWAAGEPDFDGLAIAMYGLESDSIDPYHAPGTWNAWPIRDDISPDQKCWALVEWDAGDDQPYITPTNEWINVYCAMPSLDSLPLLPGATVQAYDPDGVLCGVTQVKNDGSFGFMPIYRDDIYTDFDEGAEPGDIISFKINDIEVSTNPVIFWTENGDNFQLCQFSTENCRTLHLNQGWNLISWNVMYESSVFDMIADIEGCVDVVLGFDRGGLTYDPDLDLYSTLESVDFYHGYWIRMDCPADIELCGAAIPHYERIPIYQGMNLVGYWPDNPLTVEGALASIFNNIEYVLGFEGAGLTWVPGFDGFNTLIHLKPLCGYWIKSMASDYLTYPGFDQLAATDTPKEDIAQSDLEPSSKWVSIYGADISLDGQAIAGNSVIEVYSSSTVLCGRGTCTNGVLKFTPVYGQDKIVAKADGYPGTTDKFSIFVNGVRTYPDIVWQSNGDRIDISERFTSNDGSSPGVPSVFSLGQNNPNPFNASTSIGFDLPKSSGVRIDVYNTLGRKVKTIVDRPFDAGRHAVIWDGRDDDGASVSSGIYFYVIKADEFTKTRKMMLLK